MNVFGLSKYIFIQNQTYFIQLPVDLDENIRIRFDHIQSGFELFDFHQISSQATVRVSVAVTPPDAVLATVIIITRWSPFSPVLV